MAPRTTAARAPNPRALKVASEFHVPANVATTLVDQFGAKQTREVLGDIVARNQQQVRTVAPQPHEAPVAPWPLVDRYQQVIGSSLTLETISGLARSSSYGYRTWFVDVLEELLERDLHCGGILQTRAIAVAGSRVEFTPAKLRVGDKRTALAQEICEFVESTYERIPNRVSGALERLMGNYYGVGGQEVQWDRSEGQTWPTYLHHVHSRRLNYPSWQDWDVRVWDQGAVLGGPGGFGSSPTNQSYFGTRARDWPGKFIIHTPRLRGAYPTRDGLGRNLCWWLAIKGMAARSASIFIDRFAKPWPILKYRTAEKDGEHRIANDPDIDVAIATCRAMGMGTAGAAVLPDSIDVEMYGPGAQGSGRSTLTYGDFFDFINAEMSKCVLTETLTTEAGKRGNMGASDVHAEGAQKVFRYDAAVDAEDVTRDLHSWVVRLNYKNDADLVPTMRYVVDEDPSPDEVAKVLYLAVQSGVGPIDARRVCEKLGLPLMSLDDLKAHAKHAMDKARRESDRKSKSQERALAGLPPEVGADFDEADFDVLDAPARCAYVNPVDLSVVDHSVKAPTAEAPSSPFGVPPPPAPGQPPNDRPGGAPAPAATVNAPNAPRGALPATASAPAAKTKATKPTATPTKS